MHVNSIEARKTFVSFSLFFLVLLLFRLFLRGQTLEIDEAEQVFLAVNWRPGYAGQPPLYSWLQLVFFRLFGVNLLSLALLKSILISVTLYFYYKICSLYCANSKLTLAASLAWFLIPTIGFDLLKDNTHTILALLFAGLCWYYFIAPCVQNNLSKPLWYTGFGLILGLGFLTKFNFVLFLITFIIAILTIKETRAKLLDPYFIWSFVVATMVTSPYLYWLIINSHVGFSSIYKIAPPDRPHSHGIISLLKGIVVFISPVLCLSWLFFSKSIKNKNLKPIPALLIRYHLITLPILVGLVLCGGFTYFETRWLIPILFLCPLLFFSKLPETIELRLCLRNFVIFCGLIGVLTFTALAYRANFGKHYHEKLSMMEDIKSFSSTNPWDAFISDSMLVLGTFRLQENTKTLLSAYPLGYHPALIKNNYLIFWLGNKKPYWVDETLGFYHLKPLQWLNKPNYGAVLSTREERSR